MHGGAGTAGAAGPAGAEGEGVWEQLLYTSQLLEGAVAAASWVDDPAPCM